MNRTELHPIELLLLAALVLADALLTLAVAQWRPARAAKVSADRREAIQPPSPHPLALIATELALLPVTTLRQMAGTRSKAMRKVDLIAGLIACG